jgi:hypothetical protein
LVKKIVFVWYHAEVPADMDANIDRTLELHRERGGRSPGQFGIHEAPTSPDDSIIY